MLVGRQLGPFAVDKELGGGAMGTVYRARDNRNGQFVAIKVMAPGLGNTDSALDRFEREAAILKQLKHPNIVRLFATGRYHGQPFYAMEYVQGESLDHVLARRNRMTWEEVVTLGQQLCEALQHAHERGIVHRDLKPSNIMVLKDGTVKLTDFGIAKDMDATALTSAHCTVGTASYMSPEQCRGERNLTPKSDLYSMGIMLYELLTGRKPFEAETPMDMFLQHVQGEFVRPGKLVLDIPVWLDNLVCQLLEKKPEQRPVDAAMIREVLGKIEEKVVAQKSAGVDAVEQRRVDRTRKQDRPDQLDKEAARALQSGLGKLKVRRQKRHKPFLERKWVQATGILAALLMIAFVLYQVFSPPSADKLYTRAKNLMTSADTEDWSKAREGPIKEYLRNYGDRDDEHTRQVHEWADKQDVALCEVQLTNRAHKKLSAEDDLEQLAFDATRAEEDGDFKVAREKWDELITHKGDPKKNSSVTEPRVWGLLAAKRLVAWDKAREREQILRDRLLEAHRSQQPIVANDDFERLAVEALRFRQFADSISEYERWLDLKHKCEKDPEQRPWSILASSHLDELRPMWTENLEARRQERTKAIATALARIQGKAQSAPKETVLLLHDFLAVYDKVPEAKEAVEQANAELKKLTEKS